jgi:hypothetical protein
VPDKAIFLVSLKETDELSVSAVEPSLLDKSPLNEIVKGVHGWSLKPPERLRDCVVESEMKSVDSLKLLLILRSTPLYNLKDTSAVKESVLERLSPPLELSERRKPKLPPNVGRGLE